MAFNFFEIFSIIQPQGMDEDCTALESSSRVDMLSDCRTLSFMTQSQKDIYLNMLNAPLEMYNCTSMWLEHLQGMVSILKINPYFLLTYRGPQYAFYLSVGGFYTKRQKYVINYDWGGL